MGHPLLTTVQLFTALYYVSFYQISVHASSPIKTGIDLLPALCLLVPGSVIVAFLTSRLGRYRWAIWLGSVITTVACGMLVLFNVNTSKAMFTVTLAIFGVGNGMLLSINIAIQAASHFKDRTMAACMYGFMRSLGMSVGVAVSHSPCTVYLLFSLLTSKKVSGSIFQNTMSRTLSRFDLPIRIAQESESFVYVLHAMSETDPRKSAIRESYTKGFQGVFIATTALSFSSLALSFLIKACSMDAIPPGGPRCA
jgi:MFS family permease